MVCSQVNFCLMGHVFHQYQATFLPLFTPIIPTYFLASLSSQFFTKPQRNLIRIHEVKMTKAKLIIGAFCPYFYAIYTSVLHVFPTKTEFFDFFLSQLSHCNNHTEEQELTCDNNHKNYCHHLSQLSHFLSRATRS